MHDSTASPQLVRGLQLKNLGRYPEAEHAFREALGINPDDAFALHQLATCLFHLHGRQKEALEIIGRAIEIEPEESEHFVLRSFIFSALSRPKEALEASRLALALEPYSTFAFASQSQAYLGVERWADAEKSARQALALDSDNALAANQLAQALRLQNKLAEDREHLEGMLARDPEDAFTHANAGWSALQRGDHRAAETHFRESLRLDPDFDHAREGLLNSFRARSAFYRAYLKYTFAMQRLSGGSRWAVVLGLYFGVKLSNYAFRGGTYQFVGIAISAIYFVLVLWVWIARGVGNFILLFDRFAKHALRRSERVEAIAVGGGLTAGLVLFAVGLIWNLIIPIVLGGALVAAAFPFSMTFTNDSKAGRVLFGSIGGGMLAISLAMIVASFNPTTTPETYFGYYGIGLITCLACTILGNIPALRR